MIRCATYTLAAALPLWGLAFTYWYQWGPLLAVAGAVIWITAGCVDWVAGR